MSVTHLAACLAGSILTTAIGAHADYYSRANGARYAALDTFASALSVITNQYVTPVDERQLIENAVSGMINELDKYSVYYDAEQFRRMREDTGGEFGGIGITELIEQESAIDNPLPPIVENVLADSPAGRAGIARGDFLLVVDGTPTMAVTDEKLGSEHWMAKLRGPADTRVRIEVIRSGWLKSRSFDLVRQHIKVPSVESFTLEPGIGYIAVSRFQEATSEDVKQALVTLNKRGMRVLLFDLRDNPGGLVNQAVQVADLFLDKGTIVSIRGRPGIKEERHVATRETTFSKMRILVLVDNDSASAAEIVIGALKDHGRAQILGLKSYGKGSVQTFYQLKGGGGFKMTTAYYFSPKGHSLEGSGIKPDIHVEMFAPDVIVAGDSSTRDPDAPAADDGPSRPGQAGASEASTLPERLRDDHQFNVAYQTARTWLVSN